MNKSLTDKELEYVARVIKDKILYLVIASESQHS
jgi:hypothetical protein